MDLSTIRNLWGNKDTKQRQYKKIVNPFLLQDET